MKFVAHGTSTPLTIDRFTVWFTDLDMRADGASAETLVMQSRFVTLRIADESLLKLTPPVNPGQSQGVSGIDPPDGLISASGISAVVLLPDDPDPVYSTLRRSVGFTFEGARRRCAGSTASATAAPAATSSCR